MVGATHMTNGEGNMQVTAKIWWTNVQQFGTQPYIANFTLSDASADMSGNGWMEVSTIAFDTPPIDDLDLVSPQ